MTSKIESVKNHIKRNKVTYIACAATAVVVGGVTYYVTKNGSAAKAAVGTVEYAGDTVLHNAPTMNNIIAWKPTMRNVVEFAEDSTPSRPVGLLNADGGIKMAFKSIGEAARVTGLTKTQISKVVNGVADSAEGLKFAALENLEKVVA